MNIVSYKGMFIHYRRGGSVEKWGVYENLMRVRRGVYEKFCTS